MTEATPPSGDQPTDAGASGTPAPAAPAAQSDAPPKPADTPAPPSADGQPAPTPDEPPAPDGTPKPTEFKLPDEHKDKPWASKVKSEADLYAQLDTLTALKGKKMIVPDLTTASEAEREEYFKLTRPANGIEGYSFGDAPIDPIIKDAVGQSLLKNGLTAFQANEVIKDYQAAEGKLLAAQYDPEAIKTTMTEAFGDKWETVVGATKNALNGIMTPEDGTLLDNLPNTYMALVYRTFGNVLQAVEKVRSAYGIKESTAHILAGSGAVQPTDVNAVREGLRAKIAGLHHKPHTNAEKAALQKQLADTYLNDPRIKKGA